MAAAMEALTEAHPTRSFEFTAAVAGGKGASISSFSSQQEEGHRNSGGALRVCGA